MIASITACSPFAVENEVEPAASDVTEAPAPKKPAKGPPASASSSTSTSTSPTMPGGNVDVCAGATFCETFEGGARGNGLWEDFKAVNGDTFEPQPPSAGPGASSLFVLVPPGSQTKHSSLARNIGDFGHVEMVFSIQVPSTFGPDGHTNIAHLDFGASADLVALIVGENDQLGLVIKDNHRDFQLVNKVSVSANEWHKVRLVIDVPGTPPTAHLDIDGTDAVTRDTLDVSFDGPPPLRLTLGPDYKTTQDPFLMRIDDLRIDARD